MSVIKLESSDGKVFEVPADVARCSGTIRTMMDDCGLDDPSQAVPLSKVSSTVLSKILLWAEYHRDDPIPAEDDENKEKRTDDIPAWDACFLSVDQGVLFELILAANYLDIKGLLEVACKTVANLIKGKSPEEIRNAFNINCDFSAAEEEQVRRENEWREDQL